MDRYKSSRLGGIHIGFVPYGGSEEEGQTLQLVFRKQVVRKPNRKKIMSGRKFFTILRNLHCCSVHTQPSAEDYDPSYKVAELRDMLEEKCSKLFVPGQQLSLDETLIRAFGRMKFKVKIVSKAARYGIKI
jgi:Transposase IS4